MTARRILVTSVNLNEKLNSICGLSRECGQNPGPNKF